MFMGAINLRPGQELRTFDVFRDGEHATASGRVLSNDRQHLGAVKAILAAAKPEEKERWRQLEHPVSHKIIQKGAPSFDVRPGDWFERGGKRYIVQAAPYNVGDLGHWTIYYCDERSDA